MNPPPDFKVLPSYSLTFHTYTGLIGTQEPHCTVPYNRHCLSARNIVINYVSSEICISRMLFLSFSNQFVSQTFKYDMFVEIVVGGL
jgi:hypothetical protein